ncbi:hypothetical protein [Streptomyces sp. SAJ15]|uniref:hypothetical protein n=1 Tax=Streptomyces sp. SAJ15 TaxID=2011095 RepID=UPI00118588D7|nr:hypothetical protein [Streptomyces sp. SAJ15]TVL89833.1 hypothetical protein CD790_25915 [Streptomyces sp. SAJ15]
MTTPKDLARLAAAVKSRRHELGITRLAAATAAGMAKGTWQRVEEGAPVREMNYAKIEKVLRWASGSCIATRGGGEPLPVEPGATEGVLIASASPELEAAVSQAVQTASIAVSDHLTAPEIRELSARVVQELKDRGVL